MMTRMVWANDEVASVVNGRFTPVRIGVSENGASLEAQERYQAYITPTTTITDAEGNVIEQVQGAMTKSEFLALPEKPSISNLVH